MTVIVPGARVPRPRQAIPVRRRVLETVEDFSVTATAEAQAVAQALRTASLLCEQAPPRPDLAAQHIHEALPRLETIAAAGRALTRTCEAEIGQATRA